MNIPIRPDDGSVAHFSGYRVQHYNALGPYKGGLRYHPNVTIGELRWLACLMSLKTALVQLPLGGPKSRCIFLMKYLVSCCSSDELRPRPFQFLSFKTVRV